MVRISDITPDTRITVMCNDNNDKEEEQIITVNLPCLEFNIPPVQRGLVWEPRQVMDLWDSLSKGYPIGSFMAYGNGDPLELLDGQQRFNAIRMGTKIGKEQQATLWVRCDEKGNKPRFMVCTFSHPWGFNENYGVFSASEQAKANDHFLNIEASEQAKANGSSLEYASYKIENFEDCFRKADLKHGYPWLDEGKGFVPVPFLMDDDVENGWDSWHSSAIYQSIPNAEKATFEMIHSATWLKKIKSTVIPVIRWQKDDNVNVDELFTRINKGGIQLNTVDQRYSAICVYTGQEIKKKNNDLAENFLPPERVATLAARIAFSQFYKKWIDDVSPDMIKKWFLEEEQKPCADYLQSLYNDDGRLKQVIECFRALCRHGDKKGIPSSIYLSTRDTWLWNILWVIDNFKLKKDDTDTKKYFPLFCMLPHVLVGSTSGVAINEFCKSFYDGIKNLKSDTDTPLLVLMAVGCANAALYSRSCMYPYPTSLSSIKLECSDYTTEGKPYEQLWLDSFTKHWGTSTNPILFYYQRFYMNHLLDGSRFNPGMRSHWMSSSNRPWDMDHIIPNDWWKNNEYERNHISNMQVLDFRRNRIKKNHSTDVPLFDRDVPFDKEWNKCLRDEEDNMNRNNMYEASSSPDIRTGLLNRLNHIIKSTVEDIYLVDLISEINKLAASDSKQPEGLPNSLHNAILRYYLMKDIAEKLRSKNHEVCWGTVKFQWRQQRKNLDGVSTVSLEEPDFYHSLTQELSVGIPKKDALLLVGLNANAVDSRWEIGLRRGLDVSLDAWFNKYGNKQNHWWLEYIHWQDEIKAHKIVNAILELNKKQ